MIEYVDENKYFPKITIYLLTHSEKWKKTRKIKDVVTKSKENLNILQNLFSISNNYFQQRIDCGHNATIDILEDNVLNENYNLPLDTINLASDTIDSNMNPNPPSLLVYAQNVPFQIIGGCQLGFLAENNIRIIKIMRIKDLRQRKKRECSYFQKNNLPSRYTCTGRGSLRYCKYKPQT